MGLARREAMLQRWASVAGLIGCMSLVACGGGDDGPPGLVVPGGETNKNPAVGVDANGNPIDENGNPVDPRLDGRYELSNYFDLTSAGIFPDAANDTLKALSNFRESPSRTIVEVAAANNVPVVDTLMNVLPGVVKDIVFGALDEYVFNALFQKAPVTKTITEIIDDLASITTKFELVTQLDLPPGDELGNTPAYHQVSGVAWNWMDKRNVITPEQALPGLKFEREIVQTNAVRLETKSSTLETGRLTIGEHTITVPLGTFAIAAVDRLIQDKFGAKDLRDAMGKIVNCDALAESVSKKCVGNVCVGHKTEVKNVCTVGLDLIVALVRGQIMRLDIPLLNMDHGTAQMWDAPVEGGPQDALIDRIDNGYWTSSVNVKSDKKTILSWFVGRRIGEFGVEPGATR